MFDCERQGHGIRAAAGVGLGLGARATLAPAMILAALVVVCLLKGRQGRVPRGVSMLTWSTLVYLWVVTAVLSMWGTVFAISHPDIGNPWQLFRQMLLGSPFASRATAAQDGPGYDGDSMSGLAASGASHLTLGDLVGPVRLLHRPGARVIRRRRGFDLGRAPLTRCTLVRTGPAAIGRGAKGWKG